MIRTRRLRPRWLYKVLQKMKLFYSHICALAENRTIGFQNKLPWHIPEDLKFFKQKTLNKIIIMGRKTFESLGRPLPNRLNIVLTSRPKLLKNIKNITVFSSLEKAFHFCEEYKLKTSHPQENYGNEIFIIGGGQLFKESLHKVQFLYLTHIHKNYKGDAFYPEIPNDLFKEIDRKHCPGKPAYSFVTYKKI